MKKCLFILVFLLSFFLTVTYCYAEEILVEPIQEEIKEDDNKTDNVIYDNSFEFDNYDDQSASSGSNYVIVEEPTPEPTLIISYNNLNTVSWNSVSENLISIDQQIIDLRSDFNSFRDLYISNNAVVSNNIIKKRLSDYTVSESIGLITLLMAFCAGLVYLIHKSIYRWR